MNFRTILPRIISKYLGIKYALIPLLILAVLTACKNSDPDKNWEHITTIPLEDVNPIGLAVTSEGLWLSDGDHNRLVLIDEAGKPVREIDALDRPMHIANSQDTLLVPQYGKDEVLEITTATRNVLSETTQWDAPAGVSKWGSEWAVADFYNHRVVFFDGENTISIGKKGKAGGEFYYPTDVQVTEAFIWVADAYNHRVQVFDKTGKFLQIIGEDQKMNAATGIFVSEVQLFVTDFENNRVLVFDHQGALIQEIKNNIHKPTDVLLSDDILYVVNYRHGELLKFQ